MEKLYSAQKDRDKAIEEERLSTTKKLNQVERQLQKERAKQNRFEWLYNAILYSYMITECINSSKVSANSDIDHNVEEVYNATVQLYYMYQALWWCSYYQYYWMN